jgi:plasmid maintenance system killer protein
MLDIQLLRKDAALVAERLAARGFMFDAACFDALEAERKTIQTRTQDAQSRRNTLSKQIGMLKGNRKGQWSIRINDQWRVCFRFEAGQALDVEIVDYH